MKALLVAAATLIALAGTAAGSTMDGHLLVSECSRGTGKCGGFIAGVANTARPCGMHGKGTITGLEMRAAVLRYLSKNPQRLHLNGADLVLEALNANWPCKTQIVEKQKQQQTQADFDEYVRKQEESEPSSSGDLNALPDNDKEMLALAAVLTVNYQRCGGYVPSDQNLAVSRTLHDLGAEVAAIARVIEREKCPVIKQLYLTMREAARRTLTR